MSILYLVQVDMEPILKINPIYKNNVKYCYMFLENHPNKTKTKTNSVYSGRFGTLTALLRK